MTTEEWELRVHKLMTELDGKTVMKSSAQNVEMFNLNNQAPISEGWKQEYGRSCGGCVSRVYKRMRAHWLEKIKHKFDVAGDGGAAQC